MNFPSALVAQSVRLVLLRTLNQTHPAYPTIPSESVRPRQSINDEEEKKIEHTSSGLLLLLLFSVKNGKDHFLIHLQFDDFRTVSRHSLLVATTNVHSSHVRAILMNFFHLTEFPLVPMRRFVDEQNQVAFLQILFRLPPFAARVE